MHRRLHLVDNFGLNTGDVGILVAMVMTIREEIPGIAMSVETTHPEALLALPEMEGVVVLPRLVETRDFFGADATVLRRLAVIVRAFAGAAVFSCWAAAVATRLTRTARALPRGLRPLGDILLATDLVVSVGGGFLSSHYANYPLKYHGYLMARLLGKPVVHFSQSVGPFRSAWERWLTRWSLGSSRWIAAREPVTFAYLSELGLASSCFLAADAAFLLQPSPLVDYRAHLHDGRPRVALAVKAFLNADWCEAQLLALGALARRLHDDGYAVVLASHEPQADGLLHRLAAALDFPALVVPSGAHPREIKALYGTCRLVVSGLMRAAIFAAEQGVPFVSLSYEPKFDGLRQMLDYDRCLMLEAGSMALADGPARLQTVAYDALARRERLSSSLTMAMPGMREAARRTVLTLRETLMNL